VSGPKRLSSGSWQIRWRDPNAPAGQNQRKASYPSQRMALQQKTLIEADLLRGTYVDAANPTTVAEYMWQWIAARPLRERTVEHYASFMRHHVEATVLGARPLTKVKPSEIQAWITSRAKPRGTLGPAALYVWVGVLRSVFNTAVLDGLINRNPVLPKRQLKMPQDERRKFVPLTVEQVLALAAAMPDRYQAMVLTQAGLGLRLSELLALRVEDVDFLKRTVHIEWQLAPKTLERIPLKTSHSRRTIPLPRVVADVLAEQIREFPPAEDGTLFVNGPGGPQWGRPPADLGCPIVERGKPCGRPVRARGWCGMHYDRWRAHGTTDDPASGRRVLPVRPVRACSVEENGKPCGRPVCARGWCTMHYNRWYKRGTLDAPPVRPVRPCPVVERGKRCGRPMYARGWCRLHYRRWSERGTTDGPPPSSRKERVAHQQYGDQLAKAVRTAGLPAGTSSHDLRHHYASVLLDQRVSVQEVAERLGHADPTLVLTTYGHVMPNSEDRTRRAIEDAWAEARRRAEDAAG
jgi:integrase